VILQVELCSLVSISERFVEVVLLPHFEYAEGIMFLETLGTHVCDYAVS
jgi:hypothetical protein